jgi:hypothetical protein
MTPKELGQKAAEELAVIDKPGYRNGRKIKVCGFALALTDPTHLGTKDDMELVLDRVRQKIAKAVTKYFEIALSECPVIGTPMDGVCEGILEVVIKSFEQANVSHKPDLQDAIDLIKALKSHIDYIHGIMRGPEAEDYNAAYDVGYNKGYKEGLEEGIKKANVANDAAVLNKLSIAWEADMGENG